MTKRILPASHCPRPKLPDEVLFGPIGEFWRIINPHTEADPAAIAFQTLAAFGNLIGRTAHFTVESTPHFLNLYVALVGTTSKGRKGSSWGQVSALVKEIDPIWASTRILSGLSSGEGLIDAVRDPREKIKGGKHTVEEGIVDKRLLVIEGEFGGTLRILDRDGNTLSAILRLAWDGSRLATMTRTSPAEATNTHVSIIGHVTQEELRRRLSETEAGNGFANRFMWVSTNRSKCLPEGGDLERGDLSEVVRQFQDAACRGRTVTKMTRSREARDLWSDVYPGLSEGGTGLVPTVTSRAEAQTMRLACLYALLGESACVERHHLEAALAAWRYTEQSCRFIFGEATGNPVADALLHALRQSPTGLGRTEMNAFFSGKRSSGEISRALEELEVQRVAARQEVKTQGRSREMWVAVAQTQEQTSKHLG